LPEIDALPGAKIDVNGLKTDHIYLNVGPQHPSTHGVFRMVVGLQGETVTSIYPVLGHLHRNHEKIGERNLWTGNIPYTDRLDYICPMYNNFGYVVAVERMMGQEVPERAEYLRVIMGELARIVNHLLAIGFQFNELGAMMTPMLYAFTEREHVLDLWEEASGARMMVNYYRFGGVARDVSDDWLKRCRKVVDRLDRKIDDFDTMLTDNEIFISRGRGVGLSRASFSAPQASPTTSARWSPTPSMTRSTLTCRPNKRGTSTIATCSEWPRRGRASRS
jgi:NADH-quinone oxidoreductase subunit C/D